MTQGLPPPCQLAFLDRVYTIHDATLRPPAHRLEAYSPEYVEEEFCELRL
jgi:hypothetical protein